MIKCFMYFVLFSGRNQFVPITASGKDLLVVVQNMGDEQQYLSGHFDSVSPGNHGNCKRHVLLPYYVKANILMKLVETKHVSTLTVLICLIKI